MRDEPGRILVYDGDCSLCTKLSTWATKRWLVGSVERRSHDSFTGEEAQRLTAAGIHNELAVLDRTTGEIRSGYDGIVGLLRGGRFAWLAPLLAWGPVHWLLRHEYRLIAYNRRIFAPPRHTAACACDPDLHRGYRWAFIAAALLWTGLFAALGGLLFLTQEPLLRDRPGGGGLGWLAGPCVLAGWMVAATAAWRLPAARRLDHLGHLAWIFAAMVTPLVAASILALAGLLLAVACPVGRDSWAMDPSVPLRIGAAAWGLALPVALVSCLRRLPRLGWTKRAALVTALGSWLLPLVLLFSKLPLPTHG